MTMLDPASWPLPGARPAYATAPDPDAVSEGPAIGLVARALDTPLLPWQSYTADVAGELLPDGRYRWPVVVVTVPRQSGKSTLIRAVGTYRGLSRPGLDVFYTAQTGKDARERWHDLVKAVRASGLSSLARVRSAAGKERIVWANESTFRCFSPAGKSLHGYTPPLVFLDECFAHDQQTGDELLGAIGPAQLTIPHRQLWLVSTAGTAASTFLRRWVDAGRAGEPGVALFEWSAPADLDIRDPAQLPAYHPALVPNAAGRQLVTTADITEWADRLSSAEYDRAYGNRWTRTASHHIAADDWSALADTSMTPTRERLPSGELAGVIGVDVAHDRSAAHVVACWEHAGRHHWQLIRGGPGTVWVAELLTQLYGWGWRRVRYADDGPVREVIAETARAGTGPVSWLAPVSGRDYADAWGNLLRRIGARTLRHDGSEAFDIAVSGVATRPTLDTAAPSRKASAVDISPLVAGMVASHGLDHAPAPVPALAYRTG